ncbi:hypothetical protein SF1_16770 [Sphingobacterium faecium NBRC 15299]|jgi:molybdopterin synthase sulfur carrier subunit|uniref:MoaD/ThiS family protein n=1 Tax=Sphingobacterium faecium TaxID=34087 RepID=UPI000D33FBC7|nr:MoaD/ThiS family protein [Sphingobacterium faecium]PTX09689.1 molybdopterin synthase sulfur carrier subunit [Sphingobacterium faecium]GEM63695.1 hypothetical protein SF1_16770 [Sphingobacterium faecium NBRC 15299]
MKKIKILAFGPLAEIMEKEFLMEAVDTKMVLDTLVQQFPSLGDRKIALAVNGKIRKDVVLLQDQDTVALLPPYSGG